MTFECDFDHVPSARPGGRAELADGMRFRTSAFIVAISASVQARCRPLPNLTKTGPLTSSADG